MLIMVLQHMLIYGDRRTQVLHTGISYVNYGNFDGYDEQGNETNSFSGSDIALSVGHARNIAVY